MGIPIYLICLLMAMSTLSFAEGDLDKCAAIEDDDARLSCYDSASQSTSIKIKQTKDGISQDALSPVTARAQQEDAALQNWFSITPHRQNYLLPLSHNASSDYSQYGELGDLFSDTEIKYQLSLKTKIVPSMWRGSSLWGAYTQLSFWQMYAEEEASAPFRETNHEPEIFWQLPINYRVMGIDTRFLTLAFNHQSNGRAEPLSRSWNRLTGELVLEKNRFVASIKSWIRVDTSSNDDNPNIEHYMGRIQLGGVYKGDVHTIAIGLKNNLNRDNYSGVEVNWTFPLVQHLKGIVQFYSGYGENLIDMENYSNRLSLGIALTDWL